MPRVVVGCDTADRQVSGGGRQKWSLLCRPTSHPVSQLAAYYSRDYGETDLADEKEKTLRDSISIVGPYTRVRIIVAVVVFVIAIAVVVCRAFFG